MFSVGEEKAAGCTTLAVTHLLIKKSFALLWSIPNKHPVTYYIFFPISALKNYPCIFIAPVSLGIITTESKLLNICEMFFFGVVQCVITVLGK
jgi:hypothetical protein